jgi:hypothetical protein
MLTPQERQKHLLFLIENKADPSPVCGIGMKPSGAIFHQPVKAIDHLSAEREGA